MNTDELAEARAERDRARDLAAHLEEELVTTFMGGQMADADYQRARAERDAAIRALRRLRDVAMAATEAYTHEGVGQWWESWGKADERTRARMEAGVLAEWSGVAPAVVETPDLREILDGNS